VLDHLDGLWLLQRFFSFLQIDFAISIEVRGDFSGLLIVTFDFDNGYGWTSVACSAAKARL
jgi:hypothetical protein